MPESAFITLLSEQSWLLNIIFIYITYFQAYVNKPGHARL